MELTLLTVPACPNAAAFEKRLAAALAGHPDAVVHRREIADEREAAAAGMPRSSSTSSRDTAGSSSWASQARPGPLQYSPAGRSYP